MNRLLGITTVVLFVLVGCNTTTPPVTATITANPSATHTPMPTFALTATIPTLTMSWKLHESAKANFYDTNNQLITVLITVEDITEDGQVKLTNNLYLKTGDEFFIFGGGQWLIMGKIKDAFPKNGVVIVETYRGYRVVAPPSWATTPTFTPVAPNA
jgi:hypothetical protein